MQLFVKHVAVSEMGGDEKISSSISEPTSECVDFPHDFPNFQQALSKQSHRNTWDSFNAIQTEDWWKGLRVCPPQCKHTTNFKRFIGFAVMR